MSEGLFHFRPQHEMEAEANLGEFIHRCRHELTVFSESLDWDSDYWPEAKVTFGNVDQKTGKLDPAKRMAEPFRNFAKAYFRYQQGHKPSKSKPEMRALRCLERALFDVKGDADLAKVGSDVFDRAAALAREYYSEGMAYHAGRELERLGRFLSFHQLVPTYLDWRNPNERPQDTVRTGAKAKQRREKKLPSDDALTVLADIFAEDPQDPPSRFTSAICAMLMCAPSRIQEVLSLPVDCEVEEPAQDGTIAYGWRFWPGKGAPPQIKWIPSTMESVAREAIARIRAMTEEARSLAWWLEERPDEFYPHPGCPNVEENEPLTSQQAAAAVGFVSGKAGQARNSLRAAGLPDKDGGNTLSSLNDWVHQKLPKDFPWFDKERGLRFSQALCPLRLHELQANRQTTPVKLYKVNANGINEYLGSKAGYKANHIASIFDRMGMNEGREEPIRMTTHQFRHFLNTMAQRGGMDQSEIAWWSGRANPLQNRPYDHMSEWEFVDNIRAVSPDLYNDNSHEQIRKQITDKVPITHQEFNNLTFPTVHVTEFGYCIHDFSQEPCQHFGDCLNCREQVCRKGNTRQLERIRDVHEYTEQMVAKAEREVEEGTAGADRWYDHHVRRVKRLRELIQILEDPELADGSLVRLRPTEEHSPLRLAVETRILDSKERLSDSEENGLLEDLNLRLGSNNG